MPDPERIDALRRAMRGSVLVPGDEGYDTARSLHNGMIDRHPAAIARCSGVADVRQALRFGREQGLPVSIRAGSHGLPGFAVCEGGVMIDLSGMAAVTVDPARKIARAQGGTTWGQFDVQPMPYTAVQSIVENFNPRGLRNYWKTMYLDNLSGDAIAVLTELG